MRRALLLIAVTAATITTLCAVASAASDADHATAKAKDGNAVHALVCSLFGSNTAAAAGIMGNIAVETGYSYNYRQRQNGGGNGYGRFQFDFVRSYYFNWLSQTGRSDSAVSQVTFVHSCIYGSQQYLIGAGNAQQVANALASGSVSDATSTFCYKFEQPGIPHLNRRQAAAAQWAGVSC